MKARRSLLAPGAAFLLILYSASVNAQNITNATGKKGQAVCADSNDHSTTTCTISQPVVDGRAQNGYRYSNVVFVPNDLVTVTAGGCVQTGGSGKTWKRYVNPSGPNSSRLYFGTIFIPGNTAPGTLGHIFQNHQYAIPNTVSSPNNVLALGYMDDGYGDNGYTGHDDGTDDQCKEGPGKDGGPAWVIIGIQHGKGNILKAATAPFDLIGDTVDANGLLLNPEWQYEKDNPGPPLNPGPPISHPDASIFCDGFPHLTSNTDDIGFGNPPCSTQNPEVDQPADHTTNHLFCKKDAHGKLAGHVNWWPATVAGPILWAGHDGPLPLSLSLGDDDYNFWLYPTSNTMLTVDSESGQGDHDYYIESEFDSDEVIDHFGSQWWTNFHKMVDAAGQAAVDNAAYTSPAFQMLMNKEAIITGLVGLDSEHGAYSELHPIYTMAIHVNSDVNNDQWAFFARNWGDEGYCSASQHYWDLSPVSIFIPEPVPSSDFSFVAQDLYVSESLAVQAGKVQGGLLLTFALGAPENRALVDGSVTIHWVPIPVVGGKVNRLPAVAMFAKKMPPAGQISVADRMTAAAKAPRESDAIQLPALSAEKANALHQQLQKPAPVRSNIRVQAVKVAMTAHPQRSAQPVRPRTRSVPDPVKAAKDQRQTKAICAAYDNNIPGFVGACNTN